MYRALYQQICSSDQLLHTSTNIAKNLTQREKKTKRKKHKMSQIKIQKDLPQGENPQREERLIKILFCVFYADWLSPGGILQERWKNKNNTVE